MSNIIPRTLGALVSIQPGRYSFNQNDDAAAGLSTLVLSASDATKSDSTSADDILRKPVPAWDLFWGRVFGVKQEGDESFQADILRSLSRSWLAGEKGLENELLAKFALLNSTLNEVISPSAANIASRKRDALNATVTEVIAEWDGYVEEISDNSFVARMKGLKGDGVAGKDEEAEIPISDVDARDLGLLVVGAFFRLTIAYESKKIGGKRRFTTVQFRRLPAYTKREIEAAEQETDEIINGFQLERGRQRATT